MAAEPRNESQLVRKITESVKKRYPKAWVLKTHGNGYQRVGIPDLLVCLDGRLYAFEVKHQKPGESIEHLISRVSELQHRELEALHQAGAATEVVWSVEQVFERLEGTKFSDPL